MKKTIDVGVIGIGENAHIAFNDPPADFDTKQAYIIVNLDSRCKKQQVGEGWFKDEDEVPRQAVSMTPYQIMQCAHIISPVPHKVKADAVKKVLSAKTVDPMVPGLAAEDPPGFPAFPGRGIRRKLQRGNARRKLRAERRRKPFWNGREWMPTRRLWHGCRKNTGQGTARCRRFWMRACPETFGPRPQNAAPAGGQFVHAGACCGNRRKSDSTAAAGWLRNRKRYHNR